MGSNSETECGGIITADYFSIGVFTMINAAVSGKNAKDHGGGMIIAGTLLSEIDSFSLKVKAPLV